jgi:hypothetical protein
MMMATGARRGQIPSLSHRDPGTVTVRESDWLGSGTHSVPGSSDRRRASAGPPGVTVTVASGSGWQLA